MKDVTELKVGDTIWVKEYAYEVCDYGLNKEGYFICARPKVTRFIDLDEIEGYTNEEGYILPVTNKHIERPPEEVEGEV